MFFALPFMWLVLLAAPGKVKKSARTRRPTGLLALAGFFFAIDLVSWHWSIKYTTVANATLLANFASLWVTLWAGRLFDERIVPSFFVALGLAFAGGAILMGASFRLNPERLFGDGLSLLTPFIAATVPERISFETMTEGRCSAVTGCRVPSHAFF